MEHFNITRKLHTDVLEEKYGKIHSEVIRHDNFIRESFLCDEKNIARTYALTIFEYDKTNQQLKEIDECIKNGGLIGAVFRDHGFEVRKNVTGVFVINNPSWLQEKFSDTSVISKARLSEFYAKKEGADPLIYGTVLEVYAPDFRPPEVNEVDVSQIHPTTAVLEQAGFSKSEIYEHLIEGAAFDFSDARYMRALDFMKLMPDPTREKFINYISARGL